jgi:hypothetical protein
LLSIDLVDFLSHFANFIVSEQFQVITWNYSGTPKSPLPQPQTQLDRARSEPAAGKRIQCESEIAHQLAAPCMYTAKTNGRNDRGRDRLKLLGIRAPPH